MTSKPTSSRAPRTPLVLDTRELGRRPGSMRRMSRSVPAPADLHVGLVGVAAGAPIELELRLESVMEGVLVSGTARAPLVGECARCLEPVTATVEADLQELYAYPDTAGRADDELPRLAGDLLDLEPMVRDAVVLAVPLAPPCREDCPGLCPTCGTALASAEADHGHAEPDPRWAALQSLSAAMTERPTELEES